MGIPIPGTASWNDSSNNKAFVAGELYLTSNGISVYVTASRENKAVAEGKTPDLQKLVAKGQTWMVDKQPHAL